MIIDHPESSALGGFSVILEETEVLPYGINVLWISEVWHLPKG